MTERAHLIVTAKDPQQRWPDCRISPSVIFCWRGMRPILPRIISSLTRLFRSGRVIRRRRSSCTGRHYRPTANLIGPESRCGGDPIDAQTAMAIAIAAKMVALTGFSLSISIFDSYPSRRRGVRLLSKPSARSGQRHLLLRHSWDRHHPVQVGRSRRRRPQMPRRQERTAPNLSGRRIG
jgi:hypothetical protein